MHGGGFYHQQKYLVSPAPPARQPALVDVGELLDLAHRLRAVHGALPVQRQHLPDRQDACSTGRRRRRSSTALAFFVAFWLIYDVICRVFGERQNGDAIVGALVVRLHRLRRPGSSCQLFAGRAAFLLVGAMMATTMSANVLYWIIPGQRKVVAQLRAGEPVDPVHGRRGKQRSVHNTYFTLPVLFAMLEQPLRLSLRRHAQLARAGGADARRRADPPCRSCCATRRPRRGPARAVGMGDRRHPGRRLDRDLVATFAHRRGARPGGAAADLPAGAGDRRRALPDVPQRRHAEQERAPRFGRGDRARTRSRSTSRSWC